MHTTQQTRDKLAQASALLEVGRDFEAASLLATALASDPYSAEAHALMSVAVRGTDTARSLELARRAVALESGRAWFHTNLAWAARAAKRHDEAVRAAREAVRIDPDGASGYQALAQMLAGKRKTVAEAKLVAAKARELAPHDEATWIALGNVALADEDITSADNFYREALRIDPESQAAKLNLAQIHESSGNIGSAMGLLQSIIRLDPRDERTRSRIDDLVVTLLDSFVCLSLIIGVVLALITTIINQAVR